ncbi:3D domain-containing protein [uncultured Metabacillus sp.]|uniref:3D domain-containing protein n=1 Tax=uncultured Metabacillus sp. TaxID=2860135 RepID=UPI002612078B|nr:3D domain-containing protein [uncultured Metabacillus sp.]
MNISAYTSSCKGCSGQTASGKWVTDTIYHNGYRIVAADTSILPMYSLLEIEVNGQSFKAIVLDRGGAIKGYKLDLLVDTYNNAIQFGRQSATVKVLRKGKG